MTERENRKIDREILEGVQAFTTRTGPFAAATNVCSRTSLNKPPFTFQDDFVWRARRLENQGLVQIEGLNLAGDFVMALTPEGKYKVSLTEDEDAEFLKSRVALLSITRRFKEMLGP